MADNTPDPFAPYSGPEGTANKREKAKRATTEAQVAADPSPDDVYGQKYKFTEVQDPEGKVEDYQTEGRKGAITLEGLPEKEFGALQADVGKLGTVTSKDGVDYLHDPTKLSDKEYDALTHAASKGNKLAQEILVRGHYKAQNFPTLTQDLNKVEDPFVKALSNMPEVAAQAEQQTVAATQPYDFSNAESQVNNILKNQGYAQIAQPSAQTSAYVGKLDQIASGNPLTTSALGLPSIETALGGLGKAAKESENAAPNAALLAALLGHISNQDVYGTGLASSMNSLDPAWLQQLLQAVTGTTLGGSVPLPQIAAGGAGGTVPGVTPSPTGSNA